MAVRSGNRLVQRTRTRFATTVCFIGSLVAVSAPSSAALTSQASVGEATTVQTEASEVGLAGMNLSRWSIASIASTCVISGREVALASTLSQGECDALVALWGATDGPAWDTQNGWATIPTASPSDPCGWYGVHCSSSGVVNLQLSPNSLSVQLPQEIGQLENLELLDLQGNELVGSLPPELGDLSRLSELYLEQNKLSGQIPPQLGQLSELQQLRLFGNQLTGPIPSQLAGLGSLRELDLAWRSRASVSLPRNQKAPDHEVHWSR